MNTKEKEVVKNTDLIHAPASNQSSIQAFSSIANFEIAQRMAQALAQSDLVPQIYRGKVSNCLIALEMAQRCGASVLMVMQNLYIILDKPSWSSQFIIASLNSCGKFSPMRFKMNAEKTECAVHVLELRTQEILEGPPVSIEMAKAEKWYDKAGSKWKTMPELMLRYRAAAFFGRLYAPEVLMGLPTKEESEDIIETTGRDVTPKSVSSISLDEKLKSLVEVKKEEEIVLDPSSFDNFKGGPN